MKYFHLLGLRLSSEPFTSRSYRIITPHTGDMSSWNRGGKSRLASGPTADLSLASEQDMNKNQSPPLRQLVCACECVFSCQSSQQTWRPDPLRTFIFAVSVREEEMKWPDWQVSAGAVWQPFIRTCGVLMSTQDWCHIRFLSQILWTYVAWIDFFWNNLKTV